MPQMGVSVAEGTIVQWRKRVGDWVEADEAIVEISTDKVETEIPSPASGRVAEILVEPGATVDVGTVLCRLDVDARPGEAHVDEGPPEPEPEVAGRRSQVAGNGNGDHAPPISPVVRRMADEHGVDLSQVEGSGRRGRVTKKDLVAFLGDSTPAAPAAPEPALHSESPYREEEPAPAPTGGQELSVMRKQIGAHMVRSLQTAAHCTTVVEADMIAIEAARGKLSSLPFRARAP